MPPVTADCGVRSREQPGDAPHTDDVNRQLGQCALMPTSLVFRTHDFTYRCAMRSRRVSGGWILLLAVAATLAVSCTVPAPGIIEPGTGHGIDKTAAVAPSAWCGASVSGEAASRAAVEPDALGSSSWLTINVDGKRRRARVDIPASQTGQPRPLLVSLHPFLMEPSVWDDYSDLARAATERGYIVVTPWGTDPGPRWSVPGGLIADTDDMRFISVLLDQLESEHCIDRNRVFATGFSAGAAMSQALSCWMPDRFRAVAGSGGMNLTSLCPTSPATDVLVIHGTADAIVPPGGSTVAFAPPADISIAKTVATNASRAGCDPDPSIEQLTRRVTVSTFVGCADGHRVRYVSLRGAGHTWAGTPNPVLELFVGPTNTDVSATAIVLDFFDGVV